MALVNVRRPGWWVAPAYLVMAAVMVPWIVVLAQTLPDRAISANFRLAWVGFDILLAVSLARTAWLAWKRSPFLVNVSSGTAMLLVVDAWFDVVTSPGGGLLVQALLAAVFVELPLAVLSIVLGRRAQVEIARTGAIRRYRWHLDRWYGSDAPTMPPVPPGCDDPAAPSSGRAPSTAAAPSVGGASSGDGAPARDSGHANL